MNIKQLKADDIELLSEAASTFSLVESGSLVDEGFLKNDQVCFLVAYLEKKPVGYLLGYQLVRIETDGPKLLLYDIEVAENFRRQGIGSSLVERFKKFGQEKGALELWVPTNKSNIPASKLFESTGGEKEASDDVIYIFDLTK